MTQPFADALSWVPKSRALGASLTRAHDMARAQGHGAVRLEHLLLALIEDPDAAAVMLACNVDLLQLNGAVTAHLQQFPAGEQAMPVADVALVRILEYAVAAARQSRRGDVNGAIVLAAVVGEGNSEAAQILRQHGLTFQDTVKALQRANASRGGAASGASGALPSAQPPPQAAGAHGPTGHGPAPAAPPPPQNVRPASVSMPRGGLQPAFGQAASGAVATEASATALAEARRRIEAMRGGQLGSPANATSAADGGRRVAGEPAGPAQDWNGVSVEPRSLAPDVLSAARSGEPDPVAPEARALQPFDSHALTARPAVSPAGGDTWAPPARSAGSEVPAGPARRMPPPVPPISVSPRPGPTAAPPPLPVQHKSAAALDPPQGRSDPPWAGKVPPIEPQQLEGADPRGGMAMPVPFEPARLLELLPARLRTLASTVVEVKLPRSAVFSIVAAGELPARPSPQAITMPRALTMRLRSQTGNCYVETAAPETQFFQARTSYGEDDIVRWRWVVTAKRRGTETLALAVSMRSIGPDGVAIETRLPEQTATVSVGINPLRATRTVAVWIGAVVLGGLVVLLVSGALPMLARAAGRLLG